MNRTTADAALKETMSEENQQHIEGTPEYKAAYDEATRKLENPEKEQKEEKAEEVALEEEKPETEQVQEEQSAEDAAALKKQLEELQGKLSSTDKALKDTQRWGHELSGKLKKVTTQLKVTHEKARPAILDETDGLEEAIRYVATPVIDETEQDGPLDKKMDWTQAVNEALPDMEKLLADPEFEKQAQELRDRNAREWGNPIKAISYLSTLRTEFLTKKAVEAASKAVTAKVQETQRRKEDMRIPSGNSASKSTRVQKDLINDADAVRNLTPEQFDAMRRKVLMGN